MSSESNNFLIDVFSILPDDMECLIQAPSLENSIVQNMMLDSEYDYYKLIRFDKERKVHFINEEITNSIGAYIQNIRIKKDESLLFEGFDGVEYGTLSKYMIVPEWFKEKYITDICTVSNDW
jgi:hypothetical protein